MPNWCHNTMDIYGDYEELKRFTLACKTEETNESGKSLSLNQLFPIPDELANTVAGWFGEGTPEHEELKIKQKANIEKYGVKDWYDWALDNYGSKWGANNFEFEEDDLSPGDTYFSATYDSAWSPADGLIRKISELFPGLTFAVLSTEESDAFICYSIFRNGQLMAEDGETPEIPAEIVKLNETDTDLFYEKLMDWQTEYFDLWNEKVTSRAKQVLSSK